jgi:cytochrome c oxidase assembly protein subunit 15
MAIGLACLTFPLVWIGSLVTSYDAGMAVPDWPTTYGYNMFAYPWQSWFFGPWDLFVEHGHRLFASLVGGVTLLLTFLVFRSPTSRGLRWGVVGLLAMVLAQGGVGGLRVLLNSRQVAQLHGILGPLFFLGTIWMALAAYARSGGSFRAHNPADRPLFLNWGWSLTALTFVQLLLGSQIRHVDGTVAPGLFQSAVTLHVALGVAMAILALVFVIQTLTAGGMPWGFRGLCLGWSALVAVQLGLGATTWLMNFGWPSGWFPDSPMPAWTVQVNAFWPSITATSHVALGSLILAGAFSITWIASREWAS